MPIDGTAGKIYPGSLDLESEKKARQKREEQRKSEVAGETLRSCQNLSVPKKVDTNRSGVQGKKAISRIGK